MDIITVYSFFSLFSGKYLKSAQLMTLTCASDMYESCDVIVEDMIQKCRVRYRRSVFEQRVELLGRDINEMCQ